MVEYNEEFLETLKSFVKDLENPKNSQFEKLFKESAKSHFVDDFKDYPKEEIAPEALNYLWDFAKTKASPEDTVNFEVRGDKFCCFLLLASYGWRELAKTILEDYDEEQKFKESLGEEAD